MLFFCTDGDFLCSHGNSNLWMGEDILFTHVKISFFCAKAHLVFNSCLYSNNNRRRRWRRRRNHCMNAPWPKSIQQKNFCKISFKSISLSRAYNYRTIEKTSVAKITGIMENGTVSSLLTEYEKNKFQRFLLDFWVYVVLLLSWASSLLNLPSNIWLSFSWSCFLSNSTVSPLEVD